MTTFSKRKAVSLQPEKQHFIQSLLSILTIMPLWINAAEDVEQTGENDTVITVTAQKREQNIMKVPVTVDSVYSELIKQSGSVMLKDVDKFIPGFDFSDGDVTQAGATMRGVSSPNISVGVAPSTAIFFDGVYLPRAAQNVQFSDMERIEVLKGPQGTLFGKNAAMGVVNMVPNGPEEDFDAFFKGTLGTDNLQRFEGMVNLEVSDTLFLRVNGLSNIQTGFMENVADSALNTGEEVWDNGDKDHQAVRIALKWEKNAKTTVKLSYDWEQLDQAPIAAIGLSPFAENPTNPFADTFANDVVNGGESRDMSAITLTINHEINDNWSMMFKSSFRDWKTNNRIDEDGTQDISRYLDTDNHEDSDIFYNELQINYNSERFNYVGGITYSSENIHQTTFISTSTDTVARLVTDEINSEIYNQVSLGVNGQLAAFGLVEIDTEGNIIGGVYDADTAAAIAYCTLQGAPDPTVCIGNVGYDDLVNSEYLPLEMDYMWDAQQWATTLSALTGEDVSSDMVLVANGTPLDTYNLAAQLFGDPTIFGPAYASMMWSENFINNGKFTSFGIYSDFDYKLTDQWNVFFGIRYSKDQKDFSWEVSETQFAEVRPGVSNVLFQPRAELWQSASWNKTTGRLGTGYQINDDHMVFVSYATGYKAGGFDSLNSPHNEDNGEVLIDPATGSVVDVSFKPEESENFEFGYKGILFGKVRTTFALFHNILDDRQVSKESLQPDQDYALPTIVNEDMVIDGIELGMDWEINEQLMTGFVTEVRNVDVETDAFYNSTGALIDAGTSSTDTNTSYTFRVEWLPIFDFGATVFHLDYVYRENANGLLIGEDDWVNAIPHYFDDTRLLNMRVSWINDEDNLEIGIWGNNLLDNQSVGSPGGRTKEILGTGFTSVNRGLEAGVDIRFSF
ncbi:MAG: TonB-dependent receptor [Gammaproteobacteria bacterium]|nr:TonB-dependent receptor [Gammaproteobacteria bacterium]